MAKNTPILGPNGRPWATPADEIAERSVSEYNFNCGGMVGINYKAPGARTSSIPGPMSCVWDIDYLKLDGVGSFDIPDVKAWSEALRQTGRPVHLELSNSLAIKYASTWANYSNGWRTGHDIECYSCETNGSSYPLTDYAGVEARFDQVAEWRPYGRPGAFNDYDSVEVGNGDNDGLTVPERADAAQPLGPGLVTAHPGYQPDPLELDRSGVAKNRAVISVDQDAIDASRVLETSTSPDSSPKPRGTGMWWSACSIRALGPKASPCRLVLSVYLRPSATRWKICGLTRRPFRPGQLRARVPGHGVALFRISAAS